MDEIEYQLQALVGAGVVQARDHVKYVLNGVYHAF